MSDDLSFAIERLRTSTQRLNSICDSAAQIIRDVEQFLEEAHVGMLASVSLGYGAYSSDADSPDWEDFFTYCRMESGKFRLAIARRVVEDRHQPPEVRSWSECSREEKLDSFAKLPELLVELARKVDERTSKAEQTAAAVTPLLQLPKKRKGGV